jgi:hypothetical protein
MSCSPDLLAMSTLSGDTDDALPTPSNRSLRCGHARLSAPTPLSQALFDADHTPKLIRPIAGSRPPGLS